MPNVVDKKVIESTFKKYFKHLADKEHTKAMDYIYPPLFKIMPRKALLSTMKQGDNAITIELTDLSVEKISSPKSKGKVDYAVLDYRYTLTMTFPEPEVDEEEEEEIDEPVEKENEQLSFTFEILKEKYGKNNVAIDREKLRLVATVKSQVYCFSDPDFKGWKFLEKKKGMEGLLEKLLAA